MTRPRVLLVEDEALIALEVVEVLEEADYAILGPADRVPAALTLLAHETPDVAVLDVNLAGTAVWPVAELLLARGIPFVLLSGFGNSIDVPASLRGAPRLGKPFVQRQLLEALGNLLARQAG